MKYLFTLIIILSSCSNEQVDESSYVKEERLNTLIDEVSNRGCTWCGCYEKLNSRNYKLVPDKVHGGLKAIPNPPVPYTPNTYPKLKLQPIKPLRR